MKTWKEEVANKLTRTKPSEGQNLISDMVPCHLLIPTIGPHCHPQVTTEKHIRILWADVSLWTTTPARGRVSTAARSQHRYNVLHTVGVYPSCLLPGITFLLLLRLFIRVCPSSSAVVCSDLCFSFLTHITGWSRLLLGSDPNHHHHHLYPVSGEKRATNITV